MSRSQITCKKCNRPLAALRHSGRIIVYPDIRQMRIVTGGVELTCPCGERRVVREEDTESKVA